MLHIKPPNNTSKAIATDQRMTPLSPSFTPPRGATTMRPPRLDVLSAWLRLLRRYVTNIGVVMLNKQLISIFTFK